MGRPPGGGPRKVEGMRTSRIGIIVNSATCAALAPTSPSADCGLQRTQNILISRHPASDSAAAMPPPEARGGIQTHDAFSLFLQGTRCGKPMLEGAQHVEATGRMNICWQQRVSCNDGRGQGRRRFRVLLGMRAVGGRRRSLGGRYFVRQENRQISCVDGCRCTAEAFR